jgi:hypothetical protein
MVSRNALKPGKRIISAKANQNLFGAYSLNE